MSPLCGAATAAAAGTVDAIKAAGGQGLAVGADVSDEASVAAAVDRVAAELGAPTVLINNAGLMGDKLFADLPAVKDGRLIQQLGLARVMALASPTSLSVKYAFAELVSKMNGF